MTSSSELREQVRTRAGFRCEFCGVDESDTAGELTLDHFQPRSKGGSDELENLVYCCHRCNEYKADYWPDQESAARLWNPRRDPFELHFVLTEDGLVHPRTATAEFTIRRLRLNRPQLVAYRQRRWNLEEEQRLGERHRQVLALLEALQEQHRTLLEEHGQLLKELRDVLATLSRR